MASSGLGEEGADAALLIGGVLIGHGADLEASTRAFLDVVRDASKEHLKPPRPLPERPLESHAPRLL